MQEIGKFLKSARENQSLKLEDIADRTKIHIYKLRAIEEGDRDALPAKVFCIGLIKSYARELKVDMAQVDELCKLAFETPKKDEPLESIPPHVEVSKNETDETSSTQSVGQFQFPKIAVYAASATICLALLFGIFFVIEKMNSYSMEEELPEEVYTNVNIDDKKNLKDESIEKTPPVETDPVGDEMAASEEAVSEPAVVDTQPVESTTEEVLPKEEEASQVAEVSTEDPPVPKELPATTTEKKPETNDFADDNNFAEQPTDSSTQEVVVSDNKLVVTALEPVRAEVVWSDGYIQVMLLKSQETKTLVFSSPIKLRINNGGAVQVSFNDGDKKVPGSFNQPVELDYP